MDELILLSHNRCIIRMQVNTNIKSYFLYVVVSYRVPLDASSTFDRRLTQSESIWPLSEPTFSGRAAVSLCMHSILTPRRHRTGVYSTTKSSQVGSHHLLRPTTAYTILYSQIARMITKLQKKNFISWTLKNPH